ncbi:MAG: PP2C family serine/threonine-protein phosphatase [Chlamydiota bacterium]|nr:PP2C family serine/threonine-protein phosphatase [Chlamydiota bacterium]
MGIRTKTIFDLEVYPDHVMKDVSEKGYESDIEREGTPALEFSSDTEELSDTENLMETRIQEIFKEAKYCWIDLHVKYCDSDAQSSIKKWLGYAEDQMQHEKESILKYCYKEDDALGKYYTERFNEGVVTHTTGKRKFMEDTACSFTMNVSLGSQQHQAKVYALFDGHGKSNMSKGNHDMGVDCSQYCRDNIQRVLQQVMDILAQDGCDYDIYNALKLVFVALDEEFRKYRKKEFPHIKKRYFGSTATLAMVLDNKLWVANAGDSRIFVSSSKKCTPFTYDAKANDSLINKCVNKRGGIVHDGRINGLNVCRALGNEYLREGFVKKITSRSKVTMLSLAEIKDERSHLILACDGLFEQRKNGLVGSIKDVHQIVQEMSKEGKSILEISQKLVSSALRADTTDNVTVMVVPL